MPITLSTPGVFVEEVSLLPPSVVEVGTAIPAFIGHTQKGQLRPPTRIESMIGYAQFFGGPNFAKYTVTTLDGDITDIVDEVTTSTLRSMADAKKGEIDKLRDAAEPVLPKSAKMSDKGENSETVVTVDPTAVKEATRLNLRQLRWGSYSSYLLYFQVQMHFTNGGGACYIASAGDYNTLPTKDSLQEALKAVEKEDEPTLLLFPDAAALSETDQFDVYGAALLQCSEKKDRFTLMDVAYDNVDKFRDGISSEYLNYGAAYTPFLKTSIVVPYNEDNVIVTVSTTTTPAKEAVPARVGPPAVPETPAVPAVITTKTYKLSELKTGTTNQLYNSIKNELAQYTMTLPPSGAMSGIYARVDRDRGVWKAPANIGIMGILGPSDKISDGEQDSLNVHDSGKSINAIRSFPGKGTLVWGARTLDGNSNEWRYVNVRRLFIMVEESIQKACAFAVFEPNTPTTWLKVKAMIESYLYGLWQKGAFAGASPKEAYSVAVGLGVTMTTSDINEGKMLVRVGIAAVRPAEFILLEFSHKMISDN